MRQLDGVYTQRFNRRHGRVGQVFQGRYKAILVECDSYRSRIPLCVVCYCKTYPRKPSGSFGSIPSMKGRRRSLWVI
jgi:hypothetical protein